MKVRTILVAVLAVAMLGHSAIGLSRPHSRLHREVVVVCGGSGERQRLDRPGRHELEFACTHVAGRKARLVIEISQGEKDAAEGERGYRDCGLQDVWQFARNGDLQRVRFRDVIGEVGASAVEPARGVQLPDGRSVRVACTFVTAGRVTCVVPEEPPQLTGEAARRESSGDDEGGVPGGDAGKRLQLMRLVRSALPGDHLRIRGQVVGMMGGVPCVLVDDLQFGAPGGPEEELPWTVAVYWEARPVKEITGVGDHRLQLSCSHRPGAVERFLVRLYEFRTVRLEVKGHPIIAELAETPAMRSYGLQGRAGLAPDHGMLFYFPRPMRPIMVMKTVSFPISIAFIRADGTISNIDRLTRGSPCGLTSTVPINYVLEMSYGWFYERGVKAGDKVVIP